MNKECLEHKCKFYNCGKCNKVLCAAHDRSNLDFLGDLVIKPKFKDGDSVWYIYHPNCDAHRIIQGFTKDKKISISGNVKDGTIVGSGSLHFKSGSSNPYYGYNIELGNGDRILASENDIVRSKNGALKKFKKWLKGYANERISIESEKIKDHRKIKNSWEAILEESLENEK